MKALIVAIAAAALTGPALAAPANPFVQAQVSLHHSDLDLATADGQQRLAQRLDKAASDVCGDRLASIHLALAAQARACKAEVIAQAQTQIEAMAAARAPRDRAYAARATDKPAS
jgi:UrcA family protein